jgi:hypothetical protein
MDNDHLKGFALLFSHVVVPYKGRGSLYQPLSLANSKLQ